MKKFIRRLYDWTMGLAGHKHAIWALAGIAFIESSIFPIPPDSLLVPMCLRNRERSFLYAAVCMVGSVLGGLLGYAIGYFLFQAIGESILNFYHLTNKFMVMQEKYNEYGVWIILAKGLTPFPYKIITILSGVMHMNLLAFVAASIVARSMRFFLVATLIWKFGEPMRVFIEKYLTLFAFLFLLILLSGLLVLRYAI